MSHSPDRSENKHHDRQEGQGSSYAAAHAFFETQDLVRELALHLDFHSLDNMVMTHHRFRYLQALSRPTFFKHFILGEVITIPVMKYLIRLTKEKPELRASLAKAARGRKTIHISVEYSSQEEGERSAKLLSSFLILCFPDGFEPQDHRVPFHQTNIVVTLYPHKTLIEGFDVFLPLVLIEFEALATTAVANHALVPAEKNTARGYTLQLDVQIPRDRAFEWQWDPLLEHVEGVDLTMDHCRQIAHSVKSSARFLTLSIGADYHHLRNYKMVQKIFPDIRDLRLEIIDKRPPWYGLCNHFRNVTSLSLKLPSLGTVYLPDLACLHTLRIWSKECPEALDLQLPANLQSLAVELERYSTLELTSDLRKYLGTLTQLKSIAIRHCDLFPREGNVLQFFLKRLVSLDLRNNVISSNEVVLGTPHSELQEFHIGDLSEDPKLTSGLHHLRALSCTSSVYKNTHHRHLRALWIDCKAGGTSMIESFKDYSSLTELWVDINLFTTSAIGRMTNGHALEILPATLDILVIAGDELRNFSGRPWQLKSMKRLRSLGLHANELKIKRETLPPFLHTLAVNHKKLAAARAILSQGEPTMIRLTTIDEHDWRRGPISGRFLSSYPKDETSASLDDLQARQRNSEDLHHHQS